MANNTMWLVNPRTKQRVLLAKYYPSTGWYVSGEESLLARLNTAFDDAWTADVSEDPLHGGRWELAHEGDPILSTTDPVVMQDQSTP